MWLFQHDYLKKCDQKERIGHKKTRTKNRKVMLGSTMRMKKPKMGKIIYNVKSRTEYFNIKNVSSNRNISSKLCQSVCSFLLTLNLKLQISESKLTNKILKIGFKIHWALGTLLNRHLIWILSNWFESHLSDLHVNS